MKLRALCSPASIGFALALALPCFSLEWTFDPSHSSASFAVRHMMVSTVRGHFGKISGKAIFDPDHPEQGKVIAEVDVTSIDTRNPKRDEHLRSADFFDAARYPTMRFESTRVERAGPDKFLLHGNLTIRGVTRPVTFEVEGLAQPIRDQRGTLRTGATATARIDRKDFGLTWNRVLETGGVVVGDEVTIVVDVELIATPQ